MGTHNAPLTCHLRLVRSLTWSLDTSAYRTRASRAASHHHCHSSRTTRRPVGELLAARGIEPQDLTLREIATALFGRGNVDPGGPSDFEVLEHLPRTNTMSYEDFQKIFKHCESCSDPETVVEMAGGDGQVRMRRAIHPVSA